MPVKVVWRDTPEGPDRGSRVYADTATLGEVMGDLRMLTSRRVLALVAFPDRTAD